MPLCIEYLSILLMKTIPGETELACKKGELSEVYWFSYKDNC